MNPTSGPWIRREIDEQLALVGNYEAPEDHEEFTVVAIFTGPRAEENRRRVMAMAKVFDGIDTALVEAVGGSKAPHTKATLLRAAQAICPRLCGFTGDLAGEPQWPVYDFGWWHGNGESCPAGAIHELLWARRHA